MPYGPRALLVLAALVCASSPLLADADATLDEKVAAVVQSGRPALEALAKRPEVAGAVAARDKAPLDPDAAKALQARWTTPGAKDADFAAYLTGPSAAALRKALGRIPGLTKVFSLDKDGNVVVTAPRCHDFIHGFEPKFLTCMKSGATVVNDPALDLTSKKYSVQISVPMRDDNGAVSGVLVGTFGIK
jgi:hypothetical protein